MKKAIVFAAAFAAGSAVAQVGTLSGGMVGAAGGSGAMSNMGAGGRFGAGPQIPATDARATGQAAAAARPPRSAAGADTAGANSVGVSGTSGAAQPSGSTPIVSGTSWGSAPSGAQADAVQATNPAKREAEKVEEPRDPLEDKGERQSKKP